MSLLDTVQQNLGRPQIDQIAQQIGADPATTENAVHAALPMLLGGMAANARQPDGASAIRGLAGQQQGLLDNLGGLGGILAAVTGGGGGAAAGAPAGGLGGLGGMLGGALGGGGGGGGGLGGILGSILGRNEPAVESGVQQASGLNGDQTRRLLMILAPIVLAALANRRRQQQASAPTATAPGAGAVDSDGDGIPDYLEQEAQQARVQAEKRSPQLGGILGSILNAATRR